MEKAVIRNMSQIEYLDLRSKIIAVTEHEMFSYSIIERKAYAEAAYFLLEEASIQNTDILAGNLKKCHFPGMYPRNVQEEIEYLNSDEKRYLEPLIIAEKIGLFTRCPGAHVVPAYDALINEGLQNRINRVKKYFKNCIAEDSEKKNFYKAEMIVLRAMQHRILNYAKEAERLYKDTDDDKFKHIQNACEYIAYDAPKTFFEAIQLVLLAHECLLAEGGSGSMSFGRMDQYLFPYYEKDLCEGRITRAEAESIITAFWKKIAQYELSWQNVTLGGCDKNGKDMCNDLTILCMNASLRVRGDQPQISLRVHKNMPEHVWEKAFELIQTGMGFPEIYNDEVAVKAKMNAGVSEEDAWDYSIVGCVELSAGGKEYSHTEGARFNWLKILELMLNRGGLFSNWITMEAKRRTLYRGYK